MKIEQWAVIERQGDWSNAPELRTKHIRGIVFGHPRKADGERVTTSTVIGKSGNCVVTISGGLYELGEPFHAYEAQFPGARQKVLDSLPEAEADPAGHARRHQDYQDSMEDASGNAQQ